MKEKNENQIDLNAIKNRSNLRIVQNKKSNVTIMLLSLIVVALVIINVITITIAYFSDSASSGDSTLTFGVVKVDAYVENIAGQRESKITLDNNQLIAGATTNKTLFVVSDQSAVDCCIRMYSHFKIGGNIVNFVSLNIDTALNTSWTKHTDGRYYYNKPIKAGETVSVGIVFKVSENFGNGNITNTEDYRGKPYSISIFIETVQKDGYDGNPSNWPVNL